MHIFLVITSSIGLNSYAFSIVKFLMPGVKELVKNVDFTDNIYWSLFNSRQEMQTGLDWTDTNGLL